MHNIHYTKMNLTTVKWAQWDKTKSRELLGLFIWVCIALCTIVAHNIAQNRPDNFPSYPPDNHLFLELLQVGNLGRAIESPDENLSGHVKQIWPSDVLPVAKWILLKQGGELKHCPQWTEKMTHWPCHFLIHNWLIFFAHCLHTTVLRFTRRLKVTA